MNILQVSIYDICGGAERVAWDLHNSYLKSGYNSCLVVGWKSSDFRTVVGLVRERYTINWFINGVLRRLERYSGIQAFGYYNFSKWWRRNKQHFDIVHFHNLHSSYFDIGMLPEIARTHPIIQTLHDCWTFTGHCAHPFSCERWKNGCGNCPDLGSYPPILSDRTHFNWKRRKRIYQEAKPILVCPSSWLKSMVEKSHLRNLRCELIYNGVDFNRFSSSASKETIRSKLRLPMDKIILLFVANAGLHNSHFKDPDTLLESLRILIEEDHLSNNLMLLSIGGKKRDLPDKINSHVMQLPYIENGLEQCFQAADVFVYPTKADNCPLVLIEAMASRLPIVTTDIGGCRELVEIYGNSYVVPLRDHKAMAEAIKKSITNSNTVDQKVYERLTNVFDITNVARKYISLYEELVSRR